MRNEKGAVLFLVIIYSFILSMIGMAVLYLNAGEELTTKAELSRTRAFYLAEAGLERAQSWVETFGGFPNTVYTSTKSATDVMRPYSDLYDEPDGKGFKLGDGDGYYRFCIEPHPENEYKASKYYTLVATGVCGGYMKELRRNVMNVDSQVTFTYASRREFGEPNELDRNHIYWRQEDFNASPGNFIISLDTYTTGSMANLAGAFGGPFNFDETRERLLARPATSVKQRETSSRSAQILSGMTTDYLNDIRKRYLDDLRNLVDFTDPEHTSRYFEDDIRVSLSGTTLTILPSNRQNLRDCPLTEVFCEKNITITCEDPTVAPEPFAANLTLVSAREIIISTNIIVQRLPGDPDKHIQYAVGLVGSSVCVNMGENLRSPMYDDIQLDCSIAAVGDHGSFYVKYATSTFRNDGNYSHSGSFPSLHINGCIYQDTRGPVGSLNQQMQMFSGYLKAYDYNEVLLNKLPPFFIGYRVFRGRWSDEKAITRIDD